MHAGMQVANKRLARTGNLLDTNYDAIHNAVSFHKQIIFILCESTRCVIKCIISFNLELSRCCFTGRNLSVKHLGSVHTAVTSNATLNSCFMVYFMWTAAEAVFYTSS